MDKLRPGSAASARSVRSARSALVLVVVGLALVGLTLACRPAATASAPTVVADPFVVVRATAEAAYASGVAHLSRGELEAALVDLDTAKTNDADQRQDIQQALDQAIRGLAAETPTATATTVPRTVVVATVPAAASTPTPPARGAPTPASGATTLSNGAPTPGGGGPELVTWRDPQGRFSVGAPANWVTDQHSQALFGVGTAVVQFRDPSGRSEFDVAVDSATRAVSPELYSAGLEIVLQQQVPGYAAEQMLPASTAGNPSMRRVFTFTLRDAAGHDVQARGFQVTVVKGSTPYVISGSAPVDLYAQDGLTFDRMVETFQFS